MTLESLSISAANIAGKSSKAVAAMIDLALFGFISLVMMIGFRRPYVWVLAYLYVDILAPGKIGYTIMPAIQISLLTFCAAFAGWLLTDPKKGARFTLRQGIMAVCGRAL